MDDQQFKELVSKLDTIIKLLAQNAIEGKDPKKQVLILDSFGFQPKQIADILDEKGGTIRKRLSRAKKENKQSISKSEATTSNTEKV